jgi:hypothetical protein
MTIKREDLDSVDFGDEVTDDRLDHVTPGDVLRHAETCRLSPGYR